MYSTHNERKSVVAERFIRILKNKIFKLMTAISKNVYFNVLGDIVNKYNNTVHKAIKMRPIDVTTNFYAEYKEDSNKKTLNLKLVILSEFLSTKTFFAKRYAPNWSEEIFVIKKVKNTVPWTYIINDLNGEEIIGTFYEKEL